MEARFGIPKVLACGKSTLSVCSVNCQRKFTLITYCVRSSLGERGSVCAVIRPVYLPGGGPTPWVGVDMKWEGGQQNGSG